MTRLLPTSTAGSLPKPSWLAQPETLWSPWKLEGAELIDGKQDALRVALAEQQRAGIDIVSDGEQTRQHLSRHLSNISMVSISRSVKPSRFGIAMMRACRRWWALYLAKSLFSLRMQNSCVSRRMRRSNGHCRVP